MAAMSGIDCVREQVPLADRTWFKVGGPAQYFAEPDSIDELLAIVEALPRRRPAYSPVGRRLQSAWCATKAWQAWSSALSHPSFQQINIKERQLTAGGGANLANAITVSVGAGLAGLEPLVGIPGTIGGALHGNAGTHGGDIGQWACRATVMTRSGEILQREHNDLVFAYRQSSLDELVILNAEFELEEEDPTEVTKRMQKQWIVKKANLPMAHENTGCIFQEPTRNERRHVDRSMRAERRAPRRSRSEPAAREFFHRQPRCHRQGCAAIDRRGSQPRGGADGRRVRDRNRNLVGHPY